MTEKLSNEYDRIKEISNNLNILRAQIKIAAIKSGRNERDIALVAVTKTMSAQDIKIAFACGVTIIGENRVQELLIKLPQLDMTGRRADIIGHLQTNKVKSIIDKVTFIQSVDSLKLAQTIDSEAYKIGIIADVLCEINIGGEDTKAGVSPDALPKLLEGIEKMRSIRVSGLMAIPPISTEKEKSRYYFKQMYKLFIDIGSKKTDNINMNILSMGMSSDFDIAIEEGSNMVRVGTAIFGKR